jgi:hypothetical protein
MPFPHKDIVHVNAGGYSGTSNRLQNRAGEACGGTRGRLG